MPGAREQANFHEALYRRAYKGICRPRPYHVLRAGRIARERLAWMRSWLRPGGQVLDLGCGGGELVYLLARHGFAAEGLDCDRQYVEYARQELGLAVSAGSWDGQNRPAASLDAILLFHVLEHIPNPVACLQTLRQWLRSNGRLVIEVPNLEFRGQRPRNRYHPAHVLHFSPRTLAAAGAAAGLEPLRIETSADGGNVRAVFAPAPKPSPCQGIPGQCGQILAAERNYAAWQYWLSPHSLTRTLRRIARMAEERWTSWWSGPRTFDPKRFLDGLSCP